jgi:hypothetical protein
VSQLAGLLLLGARRRSRASSTGNAFAVGLAAGACGAVGIAAFYRALATGTISIVSPVSACGALVPVVLALGIGGFLYFIGHAVQGGHTLPALFASRSASLTLIVAGVLASRGSVRLPPREVPAVAGIGPLDVGANALFAAAAMRGCLSIVSVLGSEYPVVTVIMA